MTWMRKTLNFAFLSTGSESLEGISVQVWRAVGRCRHPLICKPDHYNLMYSFEQCVE